MIYLNLSFQVSPNSVPSAPSFYITLESVSEVLYLSPCWTINSLPRNRVPFIFTSYPTLSWMFIRHSINVCWTDYAKPDFLCVPGEARRRNKAITSRFMSTLIMMPCGHVMHSKQLGNLVNSRYHTRTLSQCWTYYLGVWMPFLQKSFSSSSVWKLNDMRLWQ